MVEEEIFPNNFWTRCPGGRRFNEDMIIKEQVLFAIGELELDISVIAQQAESLSIESSAYARWLNENLQRRQRQKDPLPLPDYTSISVLQESVDASCLLILKQVLTYGTYKVRDLIS